MRVTHAEAREILDRFVNSHFRNRAEQARFSIPARPEYDDDFRMLDYIKQQEERDVAIDSLAAPQEKGPLK